MRTRPFIKRGFTLVELMVAMAAGTLVAAAAILLSKNAVALFQEESRLTYAELAAASGIDQIGAELMLAGRKSSPNVKRDARVCAPLGISGFPEGLRRLAPVIIEPAAFVPADAALNGLKPERVTIAGDLDSGERFDVRAIVPSPSGISLYLQPRSAAIKRIEALAALDDASARLSDLFRVGRILRVDGGAFDYYGVIKGLSIVGKPMETLIVTLTENTEIPLFPQSSLRCAARGFFEGQSVNVISRARYELRHIEAGTPYASWIEPPNQVAGDEGRTELVRVEMDAMDQEMPGSLRIVAEFAVDLRFGIVALGPGSTADTPLLLRLPISDTPDTRPSIYAIAGPPTESGSDPGSVRSVSVRLSVRSRAPDRKAPFVQFPGPRPYRFEVGKSAGASRFARLRTFEREIILKNLRDGYTQ
jgi:prepilin-type N-terminal cleavage/methylation domain-containing protein